LATACTWLSSKWPELHRAGEVLVRVSAGRFGDRRPAELSDDELVARVVEELTPVVGLRAGPLEAVLTRWPESFPQYGVGHLDTVAAMEAAAARLPGLALAGAAMRGVGIPACIASARHAAASVLRTLSTAGPLR
jgi:oxygen-dependent protoporphyrinogen oxidase